MFNSAAALLKHSAEQGVVCLDLRFVDLPGREQHFTLAIRDLTPELLEHGIPFDASSIQGFRDIEHSELLLIPEPETAYLDPFAVHQTLVVSCHVRDPDTGQPYNRDPRDIARRGEAYLRSTGIADTLLVGPEAEFFVFDRVRFASQPSHSFFEVEASEASWSSSKAGHGHHLSRPRSAFPVAPADQHQDLRTLMVQHLQEVGIPVEMHHHEVGGAGQMEIDIRAASLLESAERVLKYKYVVKNTAHRAGKTATFMPKPFVGENGNGLHCHQSLWKDGEPLFYHPEGYAELSDLALSYVAGLLDHGSALSALTNPTVNSYRRLVPGYEAPVNLVLSAGNRSAVVRVPNFYRGPQHAQSRRIEYRAPDPSCNPYLAFTAMMMAGLDGIRRNLRPPNPMDKNVYSLSAREARRIRTLPKSLEEALDALESDHAFLLEGGVFDKDFLDAWMDLKWEEVEAVRRQPTPKEYEMYYDL